MSKVSDGCWTCDPPEQVQRCLQCKKSECDNCATYSQKIRRQRERRLAEAGRRNAEMEAEWKRIQKLLDDGIPILKIARILGKNNSFLYFGKHAERYKHYKDEKRKGRENDGNDRDTDREV